jgi:hypothetical protein
MKPFSLCVEWWEGLFFFHLSCSVASILIHPGGMAVQIGPFRSIGERLHSTHCHDLDHFTAIIIPLKDLRRLVRLYDIYLISQNFIFFV